MGTVKNKSIHISSQTEAKLDYVDPRGQVNYPSEWFTLHPGAKPSLNVPDYSGSYEDLVRSIKGGIRASSLTIKTVKVFLHAYGLKMTEKLAEEWVSFRIRIGEAGETITPWSIVEAVKEEKYTPIEGMFQPAAPGQITGPDDPQNWTERALVLFLTCIYRLVKVTNEEYAETLQKRMEDQVRAEGGKGIPFHGVRGLYGSWMGDSNFLKMIAAYDMFLHRFTAHADSIVRMGTLGSRFRDCAGLLSFGYALNIEAGDLMDWVFIKTRGDEVLRLTHPGEETGNPYSYFAYQADLGPVRSAYSSNANPYLFNWIHVIGSVLGHKRSQNARFIFEGSYADVGLNAVLVSWVYARGGELGPQFAADGKAYGRDVATPDADSTDGMTALTPEDLLWLNTQGRDPKTWYALLKNNGFRVPPVVVKAIKAQREKIRDVRVDTVGDYVKTRFIY